MEIESTKMEKTDITLLPDREPKQMDFGKIAICSNCGYAVFGNPENPTPTCCGDIIPLKRYIEEIKGETFKNEEWSFA